MLETIAVIVAIVAVAAAIFLYRASRQPDAFAYARSITIAAPAERVFPHIADPRAFNVWNPFHDDPTIKGTYSGPAQGPGSRYTFASKRAGTGYSEIVDQEAPRRLGVRLVMTKPMACDNRVEFRLEPTQEGTRVTWAMTGQMTLMSKVLNQVIDCQKMCCTQFDKGLGKLKSIVEGEPGTAAKRVA